MSSARQLAAILFTDIAGYTAMMQENETNALAVVRHYTAVLRDTLAEYQGTLVNDYGDGNLCTFTSVTEALRCSIDLQQRLQSEPKVPLRVGLHIGEIFFEDGKALGDGVNVASRIQTLGVANSVLFSSEVYSKINNQPEFKTVSLGSFHFKNVNTPMEVFALANEGLVVPARETMEGKLRSPKSGRRRLVVAVLLVAAILYFLVPWRELIPGMSSRPQKSLLEARIAVLPFENHTNDSTLNVLGEMAADWIVQGLINLDEVKVVSSESVRENIKSAGIGSSPVWSVFTARTGAEKIIQGKFYKQGEKIIIQSQVIDPASGEIEMALPELTGLGGNLEELVQNLRSRVLTIFVSSKHLEDRAVIAYPPSLEAYKFFLQGEAERNFTKARGFYLQAIASDSNFYRCYYKIAFTYSNQSRFKEMDSVVQVTEKRFQSLSDYEQQQLVYVKSWLRGNGLAKYNAYKPIYSKDPIRLESNYDMAQATANINKPEEASTYFSKQDPVSIDFTTIRAGPWWIHWHAYTLIRLGKYEEAMKLFSYIPLDKMDERNFHTKALLYLLLNQADSINYLAKQVEAASPSFAPWGPHNQVPLLYLFIAERCSILGIPSQKQWAQRAIDHVNGSNQKEKFDKPMMARAFYLSGNLEEALNRYESLKPSWAMRRGCLYARLGMKSEAKKIMDELKSNYDKATYSIPKAGAMYQMACIATQLGNKEEAVEYLRRAFNEGHHFDFYRYEFDYELIPLFDYPPFMEFVKPKG